MIGNVVYFRSRLRTGRTELCSSTSFPLACPAHPHADSVHFNPSKSRNTAETLCAGEARQVGVLKGWIRWCSGIQRNGRGQPDAFLKEQEKSRVVVFKPKEKEEGPDERRVKNQNSIKRCHDLHQNHSSMKAPNGRDRSRDRHTAKTNTDTG